MIGLIEAAEVAKRSRLEIQLREEKWRIERENEYARQRQEGQEKAQREELDQFVTNWHKAKRIREFLSAVEEHRGSIEASSELAGWIIWASNFADSLGDCRSIRAEAKIRMVENKF